MRTKPNGEDNAPSPKRKGKSGSGLFDATDDRIANIFAEEHRNDLRYVAAWSKWHEWREGCWREDNTLHAFDLIRKTCKAHGVKLNSMAKIVGAVHGLARTDRRLAATVEQWDADPWALNTPDGIVDLRSGTTRRHDPNAYCTKITAAGPRGDCPMWKAFLDRIMGGDSALVAYLQRVFGYCLTGDTSEEALFFGYGVGNNGKGVLTRTVSSILGDYHLAAQIETFTVNPNDRHPTELARLAGARFVTASETEEGRRWAEARIKQLTGRDPVTAHLMRRDDFTFVPQFKLFLFGNRKPNLVRVDVAIMRRLNLIPFEIVIPQEERDPRLDHKLKGEWPGILAWMIDGCLDWQERGLAPPEAVTKATDAYFAGQNSFAFWIEECCERDPNEWTRTTALFASWKAWAEKAGVRYGDIKSFGEMMEQNEFPWKHTKEGNGHQGLRIRQDAPPHGWQEDAWEVR